MPVNVKVVGDQNSAPMEFDATDRVLLVLIDRRHPSSMPHIRVSQNGPLGCEDTDPALHVLAAIALLRRAAQLTSQPWSSAAKQALETLDEVVFRS